MTAPRVTVGLPVHNGENYLAAAIDSLLAQTMDDVRIVISDNASTDGTEQLCRRTAQQDDRIEYHRQPTNLGAAANYNFTLARAVGPYFLWHAHDDLRAPTALARLVAALDAHPDAVTAYSPALRIDDAGRPGGLLPHPPGLAANDAATRLHAAITSPHPDVVVFGLHRREALLRTGWHHAFVGGDRLLAAELAVLGRFVEVDEPLFSNRDHPTRYVRRHATGAATAARREWWDTAGSSRLDFPRWRALRGYFSAVLRLGPGGRDRVRNLGAVVRALTASRGYVLKQLGHELVTRAVSAVPRPRS